MVKAQAKGVLKDVSKLIARNVLKDNPGVAKSEPTSERKRAARTAWRPETWR